MRLSINLYWISFIGYQSPNHIYHSFPKTELPRLSKINQKDTMSYVFAISSLTTTLWCLFLLLISLMISQESKTFSPMLLPFLNPDGFLEIILVINSINLPCMTLEITLLAKVLRLISLRSKNLLTISFLRINNKLVFFHVFRKFIHTKERHHHFQHILIYYIPVCLKESSWKIIWSTRAFLR